MIVIVLTIVLLVAAVASIAGVIMFLDYAHKTLDQD